MLRPRLSSFCESALALASSAQAAFILESGKAAAKFLRMFDQAITRFKDFLWRLPWAVFLLVLLAFLVLKNGLWVFPAVEKVRLISLDIYHGHFVNEPREQYLNYSYLGPLLGHALGTNASTQSYVLMHFFLWLAGTAGILQMFRKKFGDDLGRYAGLALVGLPITTTCLVWLGNSDVFVFLGASVLFLTSSWLVALLAGLLLGVAHFEQTALILLLLLLPAWLLKKPAVLSARLLLLGLAGAVAGRLLLQGWFYLEHIHLAMDRVNYVLTAGDSQFAFALAAHFGVLLLSLFGAFWPYLVFRLEALRESDRRPFWGVVVALLLAAAVLGVVLDSTRIFALLSWPLFLLLLPGMLDEGRRRDELRKIFLACALAAILFPPLMVWSGQIFSSANYVFAGRVLTAVQDSEPVFPDNYKRYNELYK